MASINSLSASPVIGNTATSGEQPSGSIRYQNFKLTLLKAVRALQKLLSPAPASALGRKISVQEEVWQAIEASESMPLLSQAAEPNEPQPTTVAEMLGLAQQALNANLQTAQAMIDDQLAGIDAALQLYQNQREQLRQQQADYAQEYSAELAAIVSDSHDPIEGLQQQIELCGEQIQHYRSLRQPLAHAKKCMEQHSLELQQQVTQLRAQEATAETDSMLLLRTRQLLQRTKEPLLTSSQPQSAYTTQEKHWEQVEQQRRASWQRDGLKIWQAENHRCKQFVQRSTAEKNGVSEWIVSQELSPEQQKQLAGDLNEITTSIPSQQVAQPILAGLEPTLGHKQPDRH
jgi:hypothetical protein